MSYRIEALPLAPFQHLFALNDAALALIGARRMVADAPNSAPCRVSLIDAAPGETLILAHHDHLTDETSPYRQGGPVFVREAAEQSAPFIGCVPDQIARRLLSARAFDAETMMLDADVVEGAELDARLRQWFADPAVEQVQIHTARRGCYLAKACRQPSR